MRRRKKNEASMQSHDETKEVSQAYTRFAAWETYASEALTRKHTKGRIYHYVMNLGINM